jgi:uncharacterized protein (DUF1330 family)
MPAYVIVIRERTRFPAELETYDGLVKPTFANHPMVVRARHAKPVVLEGPAAEDVVMLEFPSVEAAKAWHQDPGYQNVAQQRYKGGDYGCLIFEGVAG